MVDDPKFGLYTIRQKVIPPSFEAIRGMLQIGGPNVPWRMISIPPTDWWVEILLRPSRTPTTQNGGVAVKVVTGDREAETLSHYLRSGSYEAAENVASDLIRSVENDEGQSGGELDSMAEQMLRAKRTNPYGALVGGYYLLKVGKYERMHSWPNSFANWFEWLPDAAIIHAWQRLGQTGSNEIESTLRRGFQPDSQGDSRQRLLQAARFGLPFFTEGARYLIDGLELCVNIARKAGLIDEAAENALQNIRRYAGAMDWLQRSLTFLGKDPTSPTLEPVYGTPEETSKDMLVFGPNG